MSAWGPDMDRADGMHVNANERQVGGDHYMSEYQHWDLIAEYDIGYLEGCASKYATRWQKKNGSEDVEKGVHYCDKLIEMREKGMKPSGYAPADALFKFFTCNKIFDIDEQTTIQLLCQWRSVKDLLEARRRMILLVAKARQLELRPKP